jgi:ankyrin repeat protein
MTAARTGDPDAIRVLLTAGAEVNATNAAGQTALMWAAAANNPSAIAALIARDADPHPRTRAGLDALMFAVRRGQTAAAIALIEAGADVNGTMKNGESVLEVAIVNTHWGLADMLLDRGADPNQAKAGYTALHRLAVLRPIVSGVVYNEDLPIPLGSLDIILDLVKKMIAKGVDVNARMTKGDALKEQKFQNNISVLVHVGATAFLLAAKEADLELMELLLEAGADPTIPTIEGTTPLMVAAGLYTFKGSYKRYEERGKAGDILDSVKMCRDLGNDVNAVNDLGDTALHGAAYRGAAEVAEFLIGKGAQLDAADHRGLTPLAVASGVYYILGLSKSPKTAELLQSAMSDRELSTEVPPVDKNRCLYCYLTNGKQRADARRHVRKLEESFARQQRESKR